MNDLDSCGAREFHTVAIVLAVALLTGLTGCHASSPRTNSPARAPLPPGPPALGDASYDWHGLLIAPFGSVLKDVPLTLHEVLLFRDEAHGAGAADDAECYAASTPPRRFVGRIPDEYLLCFKHDRLSRIQASVRLSVTEAPAVFASACTRWSKQITPAIANSPADGAAATASGDAAQTAAACEGHDGAIHFNGRLEAQPAPAEHPAEEQVLSITLDSPPTP